MRVAFKSVFFSFVFCYILFLGSLFAASINDLKMNYKQSSDSYSNMSLNQSIENNSTPIIEDEEGAEENNDQAEEVTQDDEETNQNQEENLAAQTSDVVIVDLFSPKDDLQEYKAKYLRYSVEIGSARFFTQSFIEYKDIVEYAQDVSADIVLLKVIDFVKHKEVEDRYYYDVLFLNSNGQRDTENPNLNLPWKRTSAELQNFAAPTSMFQFLSSEQEIFIKEQSRIMVEYNLTTQKEFDEFIANYQSSKKGVEQEQSAVQNQEKQQAVQQEEAKDGEEEQPEEEQEPQEATQESQKVEEIEDKPGLESEILGLEDLYFTTLEGRWVDVATGSVFDIIALTDYNESYKGYDEYDGSSKQESLYDLDSSKDSISNYSPASLTTKRSYVVYTAYYVGDALPELGKYYKNYLKRIGSKDKANFLKRMYNKDTTWENEDLVLEFNTKTQSGVYLTENKVPVPAKFKAYPHRGYIAVRMSSGDVRYLLPIVIDKSVNSQVATTTEQEVQGETDSEQNQEVTPVEDNAVKDYNPYVYDYRFNDIRYLDKVPMYKTADIAKGMKQNMKHKKESMLLYYVPISLIFALFTLII